jgi:hypothetical protein
MWAGYAEFVWRADALVAAPGTSCRRRVPPHNRERTGRPEPAFWVSLQVLGGGQSTVGGYRFRSDEKPHQEFPLGLNRILIYTCEMQEPVVV